MRFYCASLYVNFEQVEEYFSSIQMALLWLGDHTKMNDSCHRSDYGLSECMSFGPEVALPSAERCAYIPLYKIMWGEDCVKYSFHTEHLAEIIGQLAEEGIKENQIRIETRYMQHDPRYPTVEETLADTFRKAAQE